MSSPLLQDPSRRQFIDVLRTFGILQVVLFHVIHGIIRFAPVEDIPGFIDRIPGWLNFGWQAMGVDLIFFVSAFLLSVGLFEEHLSSGRIDVRNFLIKRVARILPLYYLALVIYGIGQADSWQDMLLSGLFLGYVLGDYNVIPVGWTMEVMVIVYVALPFSARFILARKRPVVWMIGAFFAALLGRYGYILTQPEDFQVLFPTLVETRRESPAGFELYFRLWFRLAPFVAGITLAYILTRKSQLLEIKRGARILIGLFGLALAAMVAWIPVQDGAATIYAATGPMFWELYWAFGMGVFSIGIALMTYAGLANGPAWSFGLFGKLSKLVSRQIFSVYLFHMPFILIGAVIVFRASDASVLGSATAWQVMGIFGVAAAMALLFAWPLTRFVEQPLQRLLRKNLTH